jgi:hypothetical protein
MQHPKTVQIMDPDGPFRSHFDAVDGAYLPAPIQRQKDMIRSMCMNDKTAERPHAVATAIGRHSMGSKFAFDSATMRGSQNAADKELMCEPCGMDFQKLWDTNQQLLQPDPRKTIPKRISFKHMCRRVYHFSTASVVAATLICQHIITNNTQKKYIYIDIYIYIYIHFSVPLFLYLFNLRQLQLIVRKRGQTWEYVDGRDGRGRTGRTCKDGTDATGRGRTLLVCLFVHVLCFCILPF